MGYKRPAYYYSRFVAVNLKPNCIAINFTLGSNPASGEKLLFDRQKSLSEEPHDEPEKQG